MMTTSTGCCFAGLILNSFLTAFAQNASMAGNSPNSAQIVSQQVPIRPDPMVSQIRKTVAFLKLRCRENGREYDVRGTGFFVAYPDSRLGTKDGAFVYLVTNRHVAMCFNASGVPMEVLSTAMSLNRRNPQGGSFLQEGPLNPNGNIPWVLPQDESVDLAVFPIAPSIDLYDYLTISTALFADRPFLVERRVTEGEPVFFAGFFYQFPGTRRAEPIVRRGTIAMMPDEKIPFVKFPEKLYLADMHAFGGNSGSPAFINLGGFREGSILAGDEYRLFGIVNGELTEDENFNLELTTTVAGSAKANSGVSSIVPVDELKTLLDDPRLQKQRDDVVNATNPH